MAAAVRLAASALGIGARYLLFKLRPAIARYADRSLGNTSLKPSKQNKDKNKPSMFQELVRASIIDHLAGLALIGGFIAVFDELTRSLRNQASEENEDINLEKIAQNPQLALIFFTKLINTLAENPQLAQKFFMGLGQALEQNTEIAQEFFAGLAQALAQNPQLAQTFFTNLGQNLGSNDVFTNFRQNLGPNPPS